jgi:hypothetical protein
MADNLLPGDRTVKNELGRMANYKRNILKKTLINAAEDKRLSISPDNDRLSIHNEHYRE